MKEMKKLLVIGLFLGFALSLQPSWAQEGHEGAAIAQEEKASSNIGFKAIAAAIAVGLSALASGIAQGRIGAAGAGALADKPEVIGSIIILEAIPETMIILGFVVSVLIIFVL
jgi:V/A-type H+-transporting ATPase subunit K